MPTKNQLCIASSFRYLSTWKPLTDRSNWPSKIVVTSFIQKEDKILVLQRARNDDQYKLWGIPGGKLDSNETPLEGLVRELTEELGLEFSENMFLLLGTALSWTQSDGKYGLFLYYLKTSDNVSIRINTSEHLAYRWVSLTEFESLDLLTAQGEAYKYVSNKLKKIIEGSQIDEKG